MCFPVRFPFFFAKTEVAGNEKVQQIIRKSRRRFEKVAEVFKSSAELSKHLLKIQKRR
jgi:hypothetical protein